MRSSMMGFAFAAAVLCLMVGGAAAGCTEGKHGCVDCYNKWKCQKCADGWLRHPKGYCVPCAGSNGACQECRWYRRTKWCTECSDGFFLKNGKCAPCPKGCSECDTVFGWDPVYGKNSAGACVKCTGGGNHKEWCKACDGDAPHVCTVCEDGSTNKFPMYIGVGGTCEFCSQAHFGCLSCENGSGDCLLCDAAQNYYSDGHGGCVWQQP